MSLILLIAGITALLAVRAHWLRYHGDCYAICASWYIYRTKQGALALEAMDARLPGWYQLWEVWRWDYRRYVVDHDHHDAMTAFVAEELKRDDLDWSVFNDRPVEPPLPSSNAAAEPTANDSTRDGN